MLETLLPLHPRAVHFPIALALVGVLFAALGLLRGRERWLDYGRISLAAGWLGVLAAVATGLVDQGRIAAGPDVQAVLNPHITAGILLLVVLGLAIYWPLRRNAWASAAARWIYVGLLVLIVVLVAIEGWLGGKLVYDLGVGVRP